MPALAHVRADIGDIEASFVISNCGGSPSEVDRGAFDTWHFANPLFYASHAQY
jgi:hypothetical protein